MEKEKIAEFYYIINPIIKTEEFKKRKKYKHHEESVFIHSINVAWKTYKTTKFLRLDYKKATIGAALHDFYLEDWQKNKIKKPLFKKHGFSHAKKAAENAKKHYPNLVDKKVENIIKRHMFPLNIIPPFYIESWIVSIIDKLVSLSILKTPKKIYKYLGIVGDVWQKQ